jgi:hypothetical protein
MIVNVDYHVTEVCNLNCAHCSHFCPLVPKDTKPKSIEQITADFALLSKFKEHLETLGLMGGEPFLHPQFSKVLRIARQFFPNNRIVVTTNGTLADKILQWKDAIEENNITICVTIYPYKDNSRENYEKIRGVIKNTYYWDYPTTHGMTYHELSHRDDAATDEEILGCYKRWRCNQLRDGKLWICHYAAYLDFLKNAFPGKIDIEEDEYRYLDLNNDNLTIDDIYYFQQFAFPNICRHCEDVHYGAYAGPTEPWRKSRKEISEWII